jgi:DNA-binding transcriptional MocR family regulator
MADDPYYYLYFGDKPRPPSYFTLEAQIPNNAGMAEVGRVVRFDSLSKILSAGIRIGFATGPNVVLDKMDMHVSFQMDPDLSSVLYTRYTIDNLSRPQLQTSNLPLSPKPWSLHS